MTRKKELVSLTTEDIQEWYTAGEAAKKLTQNSNRPEPVPVSYVSKLGSLGKIRTRKIHDRLVLYCKSDIDAYRIGPRGRRSGEAIREKYGKTGPTVREERRAKKAEQVA